ncbi:hypothetical protein LSAT2_009426, partial [Lamellibrachia satsuma]
MSVALADAAVKRGYVHPQPSIYVPSTNHVVARHAVKLSLFENLGDNFGDNLGDNFGDNLGDN